MPMNSKKYVEIINRTIKIVCSVNWLKTIWFNLYYFGCRGLLRLPAFVYWRTRFNCLSGYIEIKGPLYTGMLRIGEPIIGMQDRSCGTVWEVRGGLIINGLAIIGRGCRLSITKEGRVVFGKNFTVNGDSSILCNRLIHFGNDCLLSWDIQIMDSDWHRITSLENEGRIINVDSPVIIEDHVWIGCRCTLLKGTRIPSDCVIAAGSVISGCLTDNKSIYGGHGKNFGVLKTNVKWS
jgi:acetyltransferase-like isoleucine patch superfamily enzyme